MENNCCDISSSCDCGTNHNKKLVILWQRLVLDDDTCPRCGSTEYELDKAVAQLKKTLSLKGVEVILEKKELTAEEFKQSPLNSNLILLNGRPLEEWLNAKIGKSQCCDVCGDEECRTIETGGVSHETIPAKLIIEAGIKAIS